MDNNYFDIPPEEIDPLELIKDVKQWNAYRERSMKIDIQI